MNCVACDSSALVEGTLMDTSVGSTTGFKLEAVSIWKSMFAFGTRSIRAYACLHCHHLQLAVNFTDEDLQRYQHFEGEQPGVLERINSEPKKLKE
jgi:hypothetical protein